MNTKTILAVWCLGASLSVAAEEQFHHTSASADGIVLTRAEVQADLAMWKRAGLLDVAHSDASPDFTSTPYRQLHEEYQRLRNSTAYTQEVSRLAGLRCNGLQPGDAR